MKNFSVVISLYTILMITGTSYCQYETCKKINEECSTDSDCCFKNCELSFIRFGKFCVSSTSSTMDTIISFFVAKKNEDIGCIYHNSTTKELNNEVFKEYGISAAHAYLPAKSKVEVTCNNREALVTINGKTSSFMQYGRAGLELSKEAANVLDIEPEKITRCEMKVSVDNSMFSRFLIKLLPYCGMFMYLSGLMFI